MSAPLVIIGNGMAAARLVEELARQGLGRHAIAVIGEERSYAYNRVLLSPYLAGEIDEAELELKPPGWWRDMGVTLLIGQRVERIDRQASAVITADGRTIPYARLVLATGSTPIRLPLPGIDLPGVVAFRDKRDVAQMLDAARQDEPAVVIGGGLLGIEAAVGLAAKGVAVTLVHRVDRLMERQLDATAAALLKSALEARGVHIILNGDSDAVIGDSHAEGLRLKDGRFLPARLIVSAVGISPRTDLARSADLATERGIVVDDHLTTSDPAISAIGECAQHRGMVYGLVEPAYDQARVLAAHLCGREAAYDGTVLTTNLKVSGVPVFSSGDFLGDPSSESLTYSDAGRGIYRKLVVRNNRLLGAVFVGDTTDALWYRDLIRSNAALPADRTGLIFGRAYAEAA